MALQHGTVLVFLAAACLIAQEDQTSRFRRYTTGPLTANDYRGPTPEERGELDAYTTTDLHFEFQYRSYRSGRRVRAWTTKIEIYAVVDVSRSWNRKLKDPRLLDHEQGHFDLTHAAALRAQDHFANAGPLRTVGSSEDQVVANLQQEFHRKMKEFVDALNDEHYRYDELTHHGLKRGEQDKQRRIQREQIATLTAKLQAGPNR